MTIHRAQTIQIFLPDGNPTSIKVADLTNRMVTAVLFPRNKLIEASSREEINKYGIYFLFGVSDEKAKPLVYIGETENCFERIRTHNQQKDFWNYAVVISSKSNTFTKSHVKFLEYLCIKAAKEVNRFETENQSTPARPYVTESMEADLLDNYGTVKILLATLGYPIFEEISKTAFKKKQILYCKGKGASAEGDLIDDGFVVFKGSTASKTETKTIGSSSANLRRRLIENQILLNKGDLLEFNEDYIFKSPSSAADTVLGRSANGWTEWKNMEGATIDQLYRGQESSGFSTVSD